MINSGNHIPLRKKVLREPLQVSPSLRERSILLVDDEDVLIRAARRLLIQAGFLNIDFASGFDEGLKAVNRGNPDLIVVDIHLAKDVLDGLHLIRRVRAGGYRGVAVAMSGDFSAKQVSRAATVGADDFLVKGLFLDFRQEIIRILSVHYTDAGVRRNPETITGLGYFRSFNLDQDEIELLQKYSEGFRFPDFGELAVLTGRSPIVIEKKFAEICEKLGVSNLSQLTHRLTICMMFHQNRL